MTPEAKVKKKVRDILKQFGCYYFAPVTRGYGSSGVPDIVGCYRGYFFAIECKANGNKPTELQLKNIVAIIESGGEAWVIDENNISDVRTILERIENAAVLSERRSGARGRAADNDRGQEGGQGRDVGSQDHMDQRDQRTSRQGKRISVAEGE